MCWTQNVSEPTSWEEVKKKWRERNEAVSRERIERKGGVHRGFM